MMVSSAPQTIGPRSYWSVKSRSARSFRLMNSFQSFIRGPRSVERLSRTFTHSMSALDLAEPLLSLDENQTTNAARELMLARGVSVLGARRDGVIVGWVNAELPSDGKLKDAMRTFHNAAILDESAGFEVVLGALPEAEHVFIEWLGEIAGVITRNDLQKAPLRMWLFGAVTLFDMNLTWAIEELYPGDSWQSLISAGRRDKAIALHAERTRTGSECRMVDCLQIKDKSDIILKDKENMAVIGFPSRNEADRAARDVEKLRNHLAHAQALEASDLETASRLAAVIRQILAGEGVSRLVARKLAKEAQS